MSQMRLVPVVPVVPVSLDSKHDSNAFGPSGASGPSRFGFTAYTNIRSSQVKLGASLYETCFFLFSIACVCYGL